MTIYEFVKLLISFHMVEACTAVAAILASLIAVRNARFIQRSHQETMKMSDRAFKLSERATLETHLIEVVKELAVIEQSLKLPFEDLRKAARQSFARLSTVIGSVDSTKFRDPTVKDVFQQACAAFSSVLCTYVVRRGGGAYPLHRRISCLEYLEDYCDDPQKLEMEVSWVLYGRRLGGESRLLKFFFAVPPVPLDPKELSNGLIELLRYFKNQEITLQSAQIAQAAAEYKAVFDKYEPFLNEALKKLSEIEERNGYQQFKIADSPELFDKFDICRCKLEFLEMCTLGRLFGLPADWESSEIGFWLYAGTLLEVVANSKDWGRQYFRSRSVQGLRVPVSLNRSLPETELPPRQIQLPTQS